MKGKIVFALASRYPTKKAYGVTVGRTAAELKNLGLEVLIVTPDSQNVISDEFKTPIQELQLSSFARSLRLLGNKSAVGNALWQIYFGVKIGRQYRKDDLAICYRDLYTMFFSCLLNGRGKHLLEVHHLPRGFRRIVLHFIKRRENVLISFISGDLLDRSKLNLVKGRFSVISMAVPQEFFKYSAKRLDVESKLRICFIGKAQSNGQDNGLELFAGCLAKANINFPIQITFVGLDNGEVENNLRSLLESTSNITLVFLNHINHESIPQVLEKNDMGIIPYPDTTYHRDRFPLKALEYAATRTLVLASNTAGNRATIPNGCGLFFDLGNPESIKRALGEHRNAEKRNRILSNSFEWATEHTYRVRARQYLDLLDMMSEN